jgi:hypothetical protein
MDIERWVSEDQLIDIIGASRFASWEESTIEHLGERISKSLGPPDRHEPGSAKHWYAVKHEIRLLVCTSDKRYDDLRKQIENVGTKSSTTVISLITASLTVHIGILAGILVPLTALALLMVARVGKNAFCTNQEFNVPIKKKPDANVRGKRKRA